MNLRGNNPQQHTARDPLHPASLDHPGFNNQQPPLLSAASPLSGNKKINKSCLECRRRKIRCDSNQPCQKCIYYQIPQCQFYTRKPRKFSSQRSRGATTTQTTITQEEGVQPETVSPAHIILTKLFPSHSLESLQHLSRSRLLQLAEGASQTSSNSDPSIHGGSTLGEPSIQSPDSDDEREWNEPEETQNPASAMCDDVNGLSLRVHRRSYMGVSSTHAILRTMFRLRPSIQVDLRNGQSNSPWKAGSSPTLAFNPSDDELKCAEPSIDEQTSIDAYFDHVHGIVPLLDEADFRVQWRQRERSDRPWLALLNMVLALGSLSAGDSDDRSHTIYHLRAKEYLDFELLGTGCMESLQALCLLGGCYLHYKNAPNMAYTIMGAAYRIAIALGLHREPAPLPAATDQSSATRGSQTRRHIWWSLFCLDTWGSMTLGRPTLGRWDPETMDVNPGRDAVSLDDSTHSLDAARTFCILATKVQHRFAQLPPLTTYEMQAFDLSVLDWHESLPSSFGSLCSCPPHLLSAQYIMQNRYHNLRLLIYRPVLLSYANRAVPFTSLQADEQAAVQECRSIACAAIDQTEAMMRMPSKLRVWSGVWYLYQASMIRSMWRLVCVEKALELFGAMASWSLAAERSKVVVNAIYEACGVEREVTWGGLEVLGDYERVFGVGNYWQLDMFGQEAEWDAMNWLDEPGLYPAWAGE
ncbi:Fungal specific transcription factor domain containing protein [Hyaloscypha variabilis]